MSKETTLCYDGQVYHVEYETNRIEGEEEVGIPNHTEITIKHVWVNLPAPFWKSGELIQTVYTADISEVDDVDLSEFIDRVETIEEQIREQL